MTAPIQSVRGMHDILPAQSPSWQFVERHIRDVFASYGYAEMRTPMLEPTELFSRSIGDATDIVEKEMYTFLDRNGASLSLRPEGTASCVRAGLEHGLLDGRQLRIWYMGPMFRHERPQKGRYRQFHQAGAEAFGMSGPDIDVELIALNQRLWRACAIEDLSLEINSLGDPDTRVAHRQRLVDHFSRHAEALDEDSRRRLETNPLRILDSKNPAMQDLIEEAPRLIDSLAGEAASHFEGVKAGLDLLGIPYRVNPRLVRGLDYYGRTVFEWVSRSLGAQGTVCAGGRYDGLVEQLGGRALPAAGFALGLERMLALMEAQGSRRDEVPLHAYMVCVGSAAESLASGLSERLRDADPRLRLLLNCGGGGFKAQMKRADRSGAALALILGEDEMAGASVTIKSLRAESAQQSVALSTLTPELLLDLAGGKHG